jgi:hypothetical protein
MSTTCAIKNNDGENNMWRDVSIRGLRLCHILKWTEDQYSYST